MSYYQVYNPSIKQGEKNAKTNRQKDTARIGGNKLQ